MVSRTTTSGSANLILLQLHHAFRLVQVDLFLVHERCPDVHSILRVAVDLPHLHQTSGDGGHAHLEVEVKNAPCLAHLEGAKVFAASAHGRHCVLHEHRLAVARIAEDLDDGVVRQPRLDQVGLCVCLG